MRQLLASERGGRREEGKRGGGRQRGGVYGLITRLEGDGGNGREWGEEEGSGKGIVKEEVEEEEEAGG